MVYVLDENGKPLMPTERHGHVRWLLKTRRAVVVNRRPFTIQLAYGTEGITQPVTLGIDPGRTNVGLCAITETGRPIFTAKAETRNKEIPKLMAKRKSFRRKHRQLRRRAKRQRRARANGTVLKDGVLKRRLPAYGKDKAVTCHVIRNKEARFSNRRRPDGWLTPTARQLLETHLNLVKKVARFVPISGVRIEVNKFAFLKLDDPSAHDTDFQNGPLKGFDGNVKRAVYDLQEGKCLLCGEPIKQYHHVRARHRNGSETIRNRVGLCENCHGLAHTDEGIAKRLWEKNQGLLKKYDALGVLNQILPALITALKAEYPVHLTTGYETAKTRKERGVPKDHHLDAYVIACFGKAVGTFTPPEACFRIRQFRRHDRQACEREMHNRKYVLNGKIVAVNRCRAFEQKEPSLTEWKEQGGRADNLVVRHGKRAMKDMQRFMPGCQVGGKTLLRRASGYYWFDDGSKSNVKKTKIDRNNSGLVFVSNTVK